MEKYYEIISKLKEKYSPSSNYYDFKNILYDKYFNYMWKIKGRETRGIITFIFCLVQYTRKNFPYQSESKPQNFVYEFLSNFCEIYDETIIHVISDIFEKTYKKESEEFYDWIEKNFVYTKNDYYERKNDPAYQYNLRERQPELVKELTEFFGEKNFEI